MVTLALGPKLKLDAKFATEGCLVCGMRGSGKSNTLVRWAEVLHKAGIPFVAVDPKGDWWGIRASADGKKPGLAVPVFGGLHGDFPLTADMGKAIADLIVDHNMSAVLDVSRLTHADRTRFLTAFFVQLMERHQLEPHVRCVIMEEAHRYIPQVVKGDVAKLKEAAAAVLLEGRSFGLGCWAATQRPARLHKDVVEECGTAIVHKIGPAATNDQKTVKGWLRDHDGPDALASQVTKLASGEAIVLAPEFDIVGRYMIDRRSTFDSGATPTGAAVRVAFDMADIDPSVIEAQLAASIEKAKANDPKELAARLRELQRDLEKAERQVQAAWRERDEAVAALRDHACDGEAHMVSVLPPGALAAAQTLAEYIARGAEAADTMLRLVEKFGEADVPDAEHDAVRRDAGAPARRATVPAPVGGFRPRSEERAGAVGRRDARRGPVGPVGAAEGAGDLTGPERRVLTVLATYGAISKKRLAAQAGYSAKGGAFANTLGSLRSKGYLNRGEPCEATPAGLEALGEFEPLPSGSELLEHWFSKLTGPQAKIVAALVAGGPMSKEALADATDYSASGGAFANTIGSLRTLELVDKGQPIRLHPDFLEAISG